MTDRNAFAPRPMLTLPTDQPTTRYTVRAILADRAGDDATVIDPAYTGAHDAYAVIDLDAPGAGPVAVYPHDSTYNGMHAAHVEAWAHVERLEATR